MATMYQIHLAETLYRFLKDQNTRIYLEDIDFAENCRLLIERSYKRQFLEAPDDKNALMKLFASLERMGYSFSEIKEASEEIASD